MGGDSTSETRVIEVVEEGREPEFVETTDYFFDKIGESVPLTPDNSSFDLQNPPSRPLAISERFRLIFVAHPSDGFCVAKTVDIINLAKAIKTRGTASSSSSILDASVVHVPIGRVSILSLSTDSSTLAASVGGDIHFFSVKSLLAKEKQPHISLSIESPNYIKNICWTKKRDASFVVLSNNGTLYSGDLQNQQPLKHVMDGVDAVDCSLKGEYLAVARKENVSILMPEFNERSHILLQFKLGFADANDGALTVDTIQWVRPDCIVLGCLQQANGKEENYLVQAIVCGNGEEITDASSRPVVLCLSDLFLSIIDDIMPFGYGPHLLLSYLETRQLAVLANRKNTDQHIVLIGWLDESDGPAVIQIERDRWLPRIELQANGDDSVVLGMCTDRASVYESIEVKVGIDEQRELSPFCIFLCLTHEGKLVIFHFASISGDSGESSAVRAPSDEEEAISTTGTPDLPTISVKQNDDKIKQVVLDLQSHDINRDKPAAAGADQKSFQNREASYTEKSPLPEFDRTLTIGGRTTGSWMTPDKDQLGPSPLADVDQRLGGGPSWPTGNERLNQNTLNSFAADAPKIEAANLKEYEKLNLVGIQSDYPVGKISTIHSDLSSHSGKSRSYVESGNRESRSNPPTLFKDVQEQPVKNFSGSFSSFGTMAAHAGRETSVPTNVAMGTHTLKVQEPLLPGKAISHAVHPVKVNPKTASQSTHSNFESTLSKKYGNMKDMMSELDKLLQYIQEPAGFMDTCTSSKNLLENLEKDMMVLCHKCTTWKSLLHEQADSIQHLLDNTVQVLARKIYMEGIVKQTRDKQYWDLWNWQKLSSELQMKRQSMINLSQELINQLIELEKHFNAIEMNSYSDNSEVNFGCQSTRSKYAPSRRIQSLHAVHNALNSQLAAAEQLSESLSRQMATLSIKPPWVKPDNVKDQLFKMIGIPCESPSGISSYIKKVVDTDTPHATPLFSSVAGTIGNDFKSNQGGTSNNEPETARRRRDSFDQTWANFEPSKTTIKRMLRGNVCPDVQRPSLFMDKRLSISSNAEGSVSACLSGHATQLDMFNGARGIENASKNIFPNSLSSFSRDKDLYQPNVSSANIASGKHVADKRNLGAFSPDSSKYSGALDHTILKHSGNVVDEKISRSSPTGSESYPQTKSSNILSFSDQYATLSQLATPTSGVQSSEALTSSTTVLPAFSSSEVDSASKSLFSSSSSPTAQRSLSTFASGLLNSTTGNQDNFRLASQPMRLTFSSAPSVASLNSLPSTKSIEKGPSSMASSTNSSVKPLNVEPQSSADRVHGRSTLSDAPPFTPVDTHPSKSHEMPASSPVAFSMNLTFKTLNRENQPSASKVDADILQKQLPTSGLNWSTSAFTGTSGIASTALASGSHPSLNSSATHGSDVVSNIEAKKGSGLFVFPQAHVSTSDDKSTNSAVAQEDEMEEEALDTSQSDGLSLGSLGGLGLCSGANTSTNSDFRSNPFGAATDSTSATVGGSTMDMAVPSGELFRPASFSFQTLQPNQQSQAVNAGGFGFGSQTQAQSASTTTGQPAQFGSGQQALGSVLGSFGQSRQLGPNLQGNNFGGGFAGSGGQSGGGFPNAASSSGFSGNSAVGGGFATASATGGFAALSAVGAGFAGVSAPAGGFAGVGATAGGFSAAASTGGGGFGALGNQGPGAGGFASFGSGLGGKQPPSQLFTQMRK